MKILIDTQVFVWLVTGNPSLGEQALKLLGNTSNRVLISYFSFFEMTIKTGIGKMKLDISIIDDLPAMGIELLMPNISELRNYSILNPNNKDPFDNTLLAVAGNEKCQFMTSDEKILETVSTGLRLLDATN